MYTLYGDGIHDDWPAIQEMINSGVCQVTLPPPQKCYLISKPLVLPSNFTLSLPRFAVVRLMDGANCLMVQNTMRPDHAKRLSPEVYESPVQRHIWGYIDDYSPDAPCENITLEGGIWDCNNLNQLPNPERATEYPVREQYGCGMLFYNVKNLTVRSLTVKDPSQYAITLDTVSYFTVEDITFDFNLGNPYPVNMDGIHLDGNCHYGDIRNLKGSCYDDMVAINAHEGSRGDITHITVDGIYADYCHSAARLLLVNEHVHHIRITNVHGNFYQYIVGITKFYPGNTTGFFDAITVDNVYAAKALPVRKGDFQHPPGSVENVFPCIYIDPETVTGSLTVRDLHRREKTLPKETVYIGENARIETLVLDTVTVKNETGLPMTFLRNKGSVKTLSLSNVDCGEDTMICNEDNGKIDCLQ